jgi:hypothetical protein
LEDAQGVIADTSEAIRLKPDYAEVYSLRSPAKLALGDKKGEISDLEKAINLYKQQGKTDTPVYNYAFNSLKELQK